MDLKQPKLIEEQIQTLKEHRMIIEDDFEKNLR